MNAEFPSIWFYTLSTIAQVCAGILAIGGAFIVYQLGKVDIAIGSYRGRVIDSFSVLHNEKVGHPDDMRFGEYYANRTYSKLKEDMNEVLKLQTIRFASVNLRKLIAAREQVNEHYVENRGERYAKDWIERMWRHFTDNTQIQEAIYVRLKQSLWWLTATIAVSESALFLGPKRIPNPDINSILLLGILVIGIISVVKTAYAVWFIAKKQPIN